MIPFACRFLLAVTLGTAASLCLAYGVAGCSPATLNRAEMATKAAAYGEALNECFVGAASYPAYETCALKVDSDFGRSQ